MLAITANTLLVYVLTLTFVTFQVLTAASTKVLAASIIRAMTALLSATALNLKKLLLRLQ
jgi:hypothetical protein